MVSCATIAAAHFPRGGGICSVIGTAAAAAVSGAAGCASGTTAAAAATATVAAVTTAAPAATAFIAPAAAAAGDVAVADPYRLINDEQSKESVPGPRVGFNREVWLDRPGA